MPTKTEKLGRLLIDKEDLPVLAPILLDNGYTICLGSPAKGRSTLYFKHEGLIVSSDSDDRLAGIEDEEGIRFTVVPDEAESGEDDDENDTSTNYCQRVVAGCQCIKEINHKGDCMFQCDDPNCPGYAWPGTEDQPHPTNTCKPSAYAP